MNGVNHTFDTTVAETTRYQNAIYTIENICYIVCVDLLRIYPADIDSGMLWNTAVLEGFYDTDISIVELCIFADQGNRYFVSCSVEVIYHLLPVCKIRFRTIQMETFTGNLSQMFFLHGKRCFIEILYIQIL